MKLGATRTLLAFWAVLSATSLGAAPGASQNLTLEQYRAELQRIETAVQATTQAAQVAPLVKSIPDHYIVSTNGGPIDVDNAHLKRAVGSLFGDKDRALLRTKLDRQLRSEMAGAAEFEQHADTQAAHGKLSKILATSEFAEVRGPTLLEVWRDKILETISRWWERAMRKIPSPSGGHQEITWIVIALAACVLAIWLKRIYERREPELPREVIPFAPSGKHWRTWMAEARAAAGEGRWRDAIHLAYWAGISQLESNGAWTPDLARTPREYLRLINASNPNRLELLALTKTFERTWYGAQPAGTSDFEQSLQHLEKLGCR